ncbi:hypothetical protein TRICI_004022 [Trichomonascus ciferrii]|uniref:Uncharacterized protein n=1 Tax=Trichomonascus ciferrii TaxID=44093 RepID=A0A642V1G4_9ASCO|nr:hypothetical protein TRICI_004022 [Trichomonascus ciferrii]
MKVSTLSFMTGMAAAIQFFVNTGMISSINGAGVYTLPDSTQCLVRLGSPADDFVYNAPNGSIDDSMGRSLVVSQSNPQGIPYLEFSYGTPIENFQVSSDGALSLNGVINGFFACRLQEQPYGGRSNETYALAFYGEAGTDNRECIRVSITGTSGPATGSVTSTTPVTTDTGVILPPSTTTTKELTTTSTVSIIETLTVTPLNSTSETTPTPAAPLTSSSAPVDYGAETSSSVNISEPYMNLNLTGPFMNRTVVTQAPANGAPSIVPTLLGLAPLFGAFLL